MSPAQKRALEAYERTGSYRAAARELGTDHKNVRQLVLRAHAAAEAEPEEAPRVDGQVRIGTTHPAPPGMRRYILTCAQNNTHVHGPFWANLQAAAAFYNAEIKVARFSYNLSAYGSNSTKPGKVKRSDDLWYDPAIAPYVCDDPERHGSGRWRLADDLLWCAEMNILPTAVRPLSGLDSYAGSSSGIFPHAKIALESLPGPQGAKFNYTTGACTLRNYIQKKEGIKAEFHHAYGALLVEVSSDGNWWARHLNATNDGSFYDLTRRFADGRVSLGHRLLGMNWGDIHASEMDPDVFEVNWAPGGALDVLQPEHQFCNDLLSFRSRSHHEQKSLERRYEKWVKGGPLDLVQRELAVTADFLGAAARPWCNTIVVSSNHDRHGERWLDEADYKDDLPNARFFLQAQDARLEAIERGEAWQFLRWGCERHWQGATPPGVRFLQRDESYRIGPAGHEVECGWHGDAGPDGARGTTQNFLRLSVRVNKGHDHKGTIRDGVYSAGACARRFSYQHGPSSHSVSHIMTYENGKRALLVQRAGRLWL